MRDGSSADPRARIRWLAIHFAAVLALAVAGAAVELVISGRFDRTLFVVIGWSPVLALHTAYAMGLFETMMSDGAAGRRAHGRTPKAPDQDKGKKQ